MARAPRRRKRALPVRDPEKRVIAVTGAYSFLGVELLRQLEQDPRYTQLLALDVREPEGLSRTQFHRVDLTAPNAGAICADLLSSAHADTFVHAAFLSGPTHNGSWAHELEVIGTVHIVGACAQAGVRKLIHWSTTGVYGPHPENPNFLTEEHALRGLGQSRYFNDRVEAEREVERFARENSQVVTTILRTAPIVGSRIANYVTRFMRRPVLPVLMGFDPLLQFLHADDAVQAFVQVINDDYPGCFNIVGPGVLPYTAVLAALGRLCVPIPHVLAYPLARLLWATQIMESPPTFLDWLRYLCVADGSKAQRVLGFSAKHDIHSTLKDFLGA